MVNNYRCFAFNIKPKRTLIQLRGAQLSTTIRFFSPMTLFRSNRTVMVPGLEKHEEHRETGWGELGK